MLRIALRKAETLVVKQFAIAFVIRAEVWSSRGKFLDDVCELVVYFYLGDRSTCTLTVH
ncbi:hypothetical protein [Nostoc sp. PCC 9305]|uniref:hypothetical protein n=1 Tax=Nostoc sp. PCC 9305 TaxID=296636 RepID=UPI0039C6B3DB